MSFMHGGNVYEIASLMGCSPDALVDFSASINPLGPPPGLMEELQRHFHRLQHYPDIHNHELIEAVARHHGVPPGQVVVGNGSTELIYWLPGVLGIKRAVIVLPTFSEYRKAFELQGVHLEKVLATAENGFQPTVDQLEAACNAFDPEAVLFTHPASPAGTLLPQSVREWAVERSKSSGMYCIVDEVFVDFCEEESLKGFLDNCPHLVLIRSMTKFYGIPGLRLGYLLASEEVAAGCRGSLPPWSVSAFAQVGGCYCLKQEGYRQRTIDFIAQARGDLTARLVKIPRFHVFPGRANYLLIRMDADLPPAGDLQKELLHSLHLLIRDCSTFEGLDDHYIRIAVRLPVQNHSLVDGMADWLTDQDA
jgi:threonine-phosphate decarboxylase